MLKGVNLGESVAHWAAAEPAISGVALIGSRARATDDALWRADAQSDWDFHLITSDPGRFENSRWTAGLGVKLQHYAVRRAAIGRVPKVGAIFEGAEADFVVIPINRLRPVQRHWRSPAMPLTGAVRQTLLDLAVVIRPGWRFLKDAGGWDDFYRRAVSATQDPRLGDGDVRSMADGFVCDERWIERKIERGELLAAQRMLHRSLAETNFQLLHELRLRRAARTFPEARRAERILGAEELAAVSVNARLDGRELQAALEKSSAACRELVRALLGDAWHWPDLR